MNNQEVSFRKKTKLLPDAVWLWCIAEGYEDVSTKEQCCFIKNRKTTNFILKQEKSKDELLSCIDKAKEKYDYIFVVINDPSECRELTKIIPDFCGIFCNTNAFGLGMVTQIMRQATLEGEQ